MGESASARARELAAVTHALRVGYRLIDTAEMYGDGGAERVIGEVLGTFGRARRSELFIVSKVLPQNASHAGTVRACEASIRRMGCDYLDLYLLHWRGQHPLEDTVEAFAELTQRGLIRNFGVSNFDVDDFSDWEGAEDAVGVSGSTQCNQVYYCLEARAIEFDLLPWQRERGIRTMAYAPLGSGDLARHRELQRIGAERGATAAQIALAWCIRTSDVVAIPKSVDPARLDENLRAAGLQLTAAEIARIDHAFRPPRSKRPLATT
jgi:diketogulonate reductase-like aldo/keto reductase